MDSGIGRHRIHKWAKIKDLDGEAKCEGNMISYLVLYRCELSEYAGIGKTRCQREVTNPGVVLRQLFTSSNHTHLKCYLVWSVVAPL